MSRSVVRLGHRLALREVIAGGKGASLARLRRRGYPVPPGFVITSRPFDDLLASLGLANPTLIQDLAEENLTRLRDRVLSCQMPGRLAASITKARRALSGPVAVRSSMIGEDSQPSSFAGQLDTVLNVADESALLPAVKRCWASVFNPRLLAYLNARDPERAPPATASFSTGVVVQRMVDAVAAGVAFNADPATGQRCVVIEATRGLGDALVSGLVTPDRYIVDARGALTEARPAGDEPTLSEDQALQLAFIVRAVARDAAVPQDVEWAWNGSQFWLLQARPITTLVGKHIYSNRITSEMAHGLIKPLLYTTNTTSTARNVFGRVFTDLIGPNDIDFTTIGKRIHSPQYTDLTVLGELFERVGLPPNFFEMMSRDERGERRRPPMGPKTLLAGVRLLSFAIRHGRIADNIDALNRRHYQELETFRRANWSGTPPGQLLARYEELARIHGETQWHVFLGPVNMLIRNRHTAGLARKRAPDVVPGDLIKGLAGLKALEPNARLRWYGSQRSGDWRRRPAPLGCGRRRCNPVAAIHLTGWPEAH